MRRIIERQRKRRLNLSTSVRVSMKNGGILSRNLESEILKFVGDLPYWQRYLSGFILERVDADREDVLDSAYSYMLAQHNLGKQKDLVEIIYPESATEDVAQRVQGVKLVALKGLHNVNAVRQGQTLPVAKVGLTVIGGLNGAGKSSIARLCNSVFYSRGDDEILPNIFEASDGKPASAVFVFEKPDGTQYELSYVADGKHDHAEFSQFACFDTKCVNIHLNQENELHVAPRGFHFFRELAELTNVILQRVTEAIERVPTLNPFIEQLDGTSATKVFISNLGPKTDPKDVETALTFEPSDDERFAAIGKEIEGLNVSAFEVRRKELGDVKTQLGALKTRIALNSTKLSSQNLNAIEVAFAKIIELEKSVQEKGAERFKESGITGAGTDTWKIFLEGGKKLADLQHEHYPREGDVCIFCSQSLPEQSVVQIKAYWDFLSSDAEAQLKVVKEFLRRKAVELTTIRLSVPDETSALARWLNANAPVEYEGIKAHFRAQQAVYDSVTRSIEKQKWEPIAASAVISVDALAERVEKELTGIDTKALMEKKAALEIESRNLAHRKKLGAKEAEVLQWVAQRKWCEDAQKAKRGISTKSITETGKRLFDEHVTKKYKQMFHQECGRLDAKFRLELTQTGKGGKSHRKYEIEGYPPGKILSEGEQRAVSLADFITELKISGINSGWVFDDPVNSQDIERKDLIAKVLVEEARERQVVVFSHDVTFLYDLNGWHSELGVPIRFHWVERQGLDAGIIHIDVPPNFEGAYQDPDRAEEKLAEAKQASLNPMERENRLKEGFSCLRTSYEAFVIQKMLAKTVVRFDRRLSYDCIEKIYAPPAWNKRVARKLKVLSGFIEGHSHSDIGRKPLTTQMLENEISEFKQMKKEFSVEQKAALQEEVKSSPIQSGLDMPLLQSSVVSPAPFDSTAL